MRVIAVLRRGDLDTKDRAIVKAVAEAWGKGHVAPNQRDLVKASGLSVSTVNWRIRGFKVAGIRRHGGGLIERGWLLGEDFLYRTLRPGPRFAGLDSDGWPMERVDVSPELVEAAIMMLEVK